MSTKDLEEAGLRRLFIASEMSVWRQPFLCTSGSYGTKHVGFVSVAPPFCSERTERCAAKQHSLFEESQDVACGQNVHNHSNYSVFLNRARIHQEAFSLCGR